MAETKAWNRTSSVRTHEGAAPDFDARRELRKTVLTYLLREDFLHQKGDDITTRIADLAARCNAEDLAALACEAREKMQLRHVPLFLTRELARRKSAGPLVAKTLERVIQRADELVEFVALYWKERKEPLSAGIKRGLAKAFTKFDDCQLAKYNSDRVGVGRGRIVKLCDVLLLCHAKPKDTAQAETWRKLVENTLEPPESWEVALSAGKDKRETWERLLREGRIGGMAVLRNLRLILAAGVQPKLVAEHMDKEIGPALPFRFVTAARYAPKLQDAIEKAMLKAVAGVEMLPGVTGLLVDVSGSMDAGITKKSETSRIDAATSLAILLGEKAEEFRVATFSEDCVAVPPRRGFALRDAIVKSQAHKETDMASALSALKQMAEWSNLDRIIVITDEQSHDGILPAWTKKAYVINVAPYKSGISYGNGWTHIDGWSERVLDYIAATEAEMVD